MVTVAVGVGGSVLVGVEVGVPVSVAGRDGMAELGVDPAVGAELFGVSVSGPAGMVAGASLTVEAAPVAGSVVCAVAGDAIVTMRAPAAARASNGR